MLFLPHAFFISVKTILLFNAAFFKKRGFETIPFNHNAFLRMIAQSNSSVFNVMQSDFERVGGCPHS